MYKIIHIHNDTKFIYETFIFEDERICNEVIILGEKGRYTGDYDNVAIYLKLSKKNLKWIVDYCKKSDAVVLYNLCLKKSVITNLLDENVKIIWRFFGFELYRYTIPSFQTDLTNKMLKPSICFWRVLSREKLKYIFKFKEFIKLRKTYNSEFIKAIDRVDLFLGHFEGEYNFLKNNWPNLPPFLNLPALANFRNFSRLQEKENFIILGNSRNPLNNHFDVLNIFLSDEQHRKHKIIIPFSYFNETSYSIRLRRAVEPYPNILLCENFLSIADYELIFKKASTFISNSLRQSALGNISLALHNGVKIYLNEKNIIFSELISQGLYVYSIDQLKSDINNNNIGLSLNEMEYNISIMKMLSEKKSVKAFKDKLLNFL